MLCRSDSSTSQRRSFALASGASRSGTSPDPSLISATSDWFVERNQSSSVRASARRCAMECARASKSRMFDRTVVKATVTMDIAATICTSCSIKVMRR